MASPHLVVLAPHFGSRARSGAAEAGIHARSLAKKAAAMNTNRPDPNAELQPGAEPLRIAFALCALLLGAVAALQF